MLTGIEIEFKKKKKTHGLLCAIDLPIYSHEIRNLFVIGVSLVDGDGERMGRSRARR